MTTTDKTLGECIFLKKEVIGNCTLYLADSRNINVHADCTITDPPYGISGGKGANKNRGKGDYGSVFTDDREYVMNVCVPIIKKCIETTKRVVLTPGNINLWLYPEPQDIGSFTLPHSVSLSKWGVQHQNMILYYGKDPYPQKMKHTSLIGQSRPDKNIQHPCPKPLEWCKWLVERASMPDETIYDPFMGSGQFGVASMIIGRKYIGVEIDERYFDLACERISNAQPDISTHKKEGILL